MCTLPLLLLSAALGANPPVGPPLPPPPVPRVTPTRHLAPLPPADPLSHSQADAPPRREPVATPLSQPAPHRPPTPSSSDASFSDPSPSDPLPTGPSRPVPPRHTPPSLGDSPPPVTVTAAKPFGPPGDGPPAAGPPAGIPQNAVLNFSAKWCGPCQQVSPIVAKLQRAGLPIQKVDVDEQQPLARRFGITSIPAFVVVVDGQVVRKLTGAQSEETLRGLCAQVPAATREPAAKEAPGAGNRLVADSGRAGPPPVAVAGAPRQGRGQSPAPPPGAVTGDPFRATVRLRVRDATGEDVGTGTVLACVDDTAYVLTCGHLFKHWEESSSRVLVELFGTTTGQSIPGRRVAVDLDADVAIVSLPIRQPLPSCPLAVRGTRPAKGTSLVSVGCNGGKPPTLERHQVVALNRYRGPDNLECTGIPVRGRSGGGLFNTAGEVVGVCMAEDPNYKDGMYAGLEPIYQLLLNNRLTALLPVSAGAPPAEAVAQSFPGEAPGIRLPPDTPGTSESGESDSPESADRLTRATPGLGRADPNTDLGADPEETADLSDSGEWDETGAPLVRLPDEPRGPSRSTPRGGTRTPGVARGANPSGARASSAESHDPELQGIVQKALSQASARDLVVVLPGGSPLGRVLVIHEAEAGLVESLAPPGELPDALLVGVPNSVEDSADAPPAASRPLASRPPTSRAARESPGATVAANGNGLAPADRPLRSASLRASPTQGLTPAPEEVAPPPRDSRRITPPASRANPTNPPGSERPQAFRRRSEANAGASGSPGLGAAEEDED